jgi:hypothetical protein
MAISDRFTRVLVTQSGVDTATGVAFSLPALDGKSAYQISGFEANWYDANTVAAGDWLLRARITTEDSTLTPLDDEMVLELTWAMQNTAGVAVAVPVDPVREKHLYMPRLTVQPFVYARVESTATAQANDVYFTLFYSIEKLSELEYLRLLAGGA